MARHRTERLRAPALKADAQLQKRLTWEKVNVLEPDSVGVPVTSVIAPADTCAASQLQVHACLAAADCTTGVNRHLVLECTTSGQIRRWCTMLAWFAMTVAPAATPLHAATFTESGL